jgi:CRP/FNR family nitrogen fixation transcriptional regulator
MYSQAAVVGNAVRKMHWTPDETTRPPQARAADLKAIDAFGTVVLVPRDQEIYGEGDSSEFCYRVVAGAVRLVKLMPDGRRQIAEFHLPGDFFAFDSCEARYLSAEAVVDVTLIRYPRPRIEAVAERNLDFARYLRDMASGALRRAHERMLLLARKSACERIATFLEEMIDRNREGDGATIELPMSRVDIADYLGLTLETVSRVLNRLHRDHVINLTSATHIQVAERSALKELGGEI